LDRRSFVAVASPLAAHAQQSDRVRRIGVLMGYAESDLEAQAHIAAFREGLQKLGWTEGRNTKIDTRWGAPDDAESMRRFAKNSSRYSPTSFFRTPHHTHHGRAAATNAHHPQPGRELV
jgi:hypothetical protein